MIIPNTVLHGRYRVINQLGHGGMGAIYQAMDENLNCVVAVKETFATTNEQRRAFRREAELLANLTHPTLPRVMDHFTHGEGEFLVMQFVPGHDLAELLKLREQPFALAKVLDWADHILDALEELHSFRPPIIHRDIKPSNLKVTPRGRILLLDFGLAKGAAGQMSTADAESHGKSIYGYSPNYAPIEQVRGAGTDPRSDLYSLAATLWTLLTGRVPPDAVTRMAEKEEGNPDPLRPAHELNSQVPPVISAALTRGMAVNRNQRYASAEEFRQVLNEVREARFESPTLAIDEERSSQSLEPSASGSLALTNRKSQPESGPSPVPLDSSIESPQSEIVEPAASSARNPFVTIAAGVLLITVVAVGMIVWRPWSSSANTSSSSSPTSPTSTSSPPVPTAPASMVYIPGGTFTMGSDDNEYESPAHLVTVEPFFIDIYEVTNEDYDKFVKATNYKAPQTWKNGTYPAEDARKPVTGIRWDDANAFASWAGKRLPTEEEWEFAARGTDGRRYPWGNDWSKELANVYGASTAEVGSYHGASPFGVFDMVGNAWEWTTSEMRAYAGGKLPIQPSSNTKVLRGGSFKSDKDQATVTYRFGWRSNGERSYTGTGFRCVKKVGK